jgi:hypothetical protein
MPYKPKTSDSAVKKATGKTWREWFVLLDNHGAKKMKHTDIARMVHQKYFSGGKHAPNVAKSGGWWSQMVTVEYERSRGLRAVNQNSAGYSVSIHGTFPMPVGKLFAAWRAIARKEKLKEKTVRANTAVRYERKPGKPLYVVMFAAKGPKKSRIGIEVMRLGSAADVEKHRARWKKVLKRFQKSLS